MERSLIFVPQQQGTAKARQKKHIKIGTGQTSIFPTLKPYNLGQEMEINS